MGEHLSALLVHDPSEPFESLRRTLDDLSIVTYSAASCQKAEFLISERKPHIIFTQRFMADGSWSRILNMAASANVPLSLIVVGAFPDTRLYASVMEEGAFDFVVPPFEREPLNFVIRSAALDTDRRREAKKSNLGPGTSLQHPLRHQDPGPGVNGGSRCRLQS